MAPRRGSSGSSSGSDSPVCPDAFLRTENQASFANDVLFFVALLGITIALCITRKKSAGKALLGWPLIACLFFFLLTYMCGIISTILLECDVSANSMSYYQWSIATVIFSFIGNWLFLVVIVFNLNALLRRQLDIGHSNMVFKIIPLAIIGIMGVLSGTLAGLTAYVNWYLSTAIWRYERNGLLALSLAAARLRIAYWILYLVSVLASGALALMTISSLRKAGKAGGDLIGWVIALTIAVALSMIFSIVLSVWSLYATFDVSFVATMTLSYLLNFFQIIGFVCILCIAKHASWRRSAAAEQSAYEPAYHNANGNGHTRHYHEAPEHFDPFKPT